MAKKKGGGKRNRDNISKNINTNKSGRVAKWTGSIVGDHSKKEDPVLRKLLEYSDSVVDRCYKRNEEATDEDGQDRDLFGIVTSYEYAKNIMYVAREYTREMYYKYGIKDFARSKKEFGNEMIREMMRGHLEMQDDFDEIDRKSGDIASIGTIHTKITRLHKFEEMLGKVHQEDTGKRRDFRIINNEGIRKELKDNDLFRSEFRGRKIDNRADFDKVKSELLDAARSYDEKIQEVKADQTRDKKERKAMIRTYADKANEYRTYAEMWEFEGQTGNRVDAMVRHRVGDIHYNEKEPERSTTHTEFGKKGKVYDVAEVRTNYIKHIKELNKDRKEGARLFTLREKGAELSTDIVKKRYQKAIREAADNASMSDVTSHSARKYFTDGVYKRGLSFSQDQMNEKINSRPDVYIPAIKNLVEDKKRKRLYNDRSYVAAKNQWIEDGKQGKFDPPKEWKTWVKNFQDTGKLPEHLNYDVLVTHEELACIISSVESGHNGRISILKHYINRNLSDSSYKITYKQYSDMFHKKPQ